MRQSLGVIANLVSGGRADTRTLAWEKLRYQHCQDRALSSGELRALFEAYADATKAGIRDAALLAILYAGGLRRSGAGVGLDLSHYQPGKGPGGDHQDGFDSTIFDIPSDLRSC